MQVDTTHDGRWAWAEIDPSAIEHNVAELRRIGAPSEVWAVVKADGYGHGSITAARAALGAGATGLCVALVDEGVRLRRAGIDAPILVLTQQPPEQLPLLVEHRLTPTAYTTDALDALSAVTSPGTEPLGVHLKVDTGMQRVGAAPDQLPALVRHTAASSLRLAGVFTHLACADEPESPANGEQLACFERALDELDRTCPGWADDGVLLHAANSAGALAHPGSRRSVVRAGIAIYGIVPGPGVADLATWMRPALSLKARISHVKQVDAGTHVSYGWRHRFGADTTVATIPIGYADGVPRRLGTLHDRPGADVLIHGRRCPIVGVVTMDQLVVDVGDLEVQVGDEVVLIGVQGEHRITADEWAERLGTIAYEIVCGISARVPRTVPGVVHRSTS